MTIVTPDSIVEISFTSSSGTTYYRGHPQSVPESVRSTFASISCPIGPTTNDSSRAAEPKKLEILIQSAQGDTVLAYKGEHSAIPDDIVAKLVELDFPLDAEGRPMFHAPQPPAPPMPPKVMTAPPMPPMPPIMVPQAPAPPQVPTMSPMPRIPPQAPLALLPPQSGHARQVIVKRDENTGRTIRVLIQSA